METILAIGITGILVIFSYTLGLRNGQRIVNNQSIEMPKIEPIKAIRQIQEDKKQREEQEKIDEWVNEMESYNGDVK